jgi:hypothetical protein
MIKSLTIINIGIMRWLECKILVNYTLARVHYRQCNFKKTGIVFSLKRYTTIPPINNSNLFVPEVQDKQESTY